ncbi:MAG TPA: MFS transporter [Allosphingosinicella sp.]|nr:MFS transporter [Allosphingosinicella sp.]
MRRRLFLLGIALFALASAPCALAPTLPLLLAGRALQGIASAMLMANSLALPGAAFAGEGRGRRSAAGPRRERSPERRAADRRLPRADRHSSSP